MGELKQQSSLFTLEKTLKTEHINKGLSRYIII